MEQNNPPDCYKCKWRRQLFGDRHSRCAHPAFPFMENTMAYSLLSVLGKLAGQAQYESNECRVIGHPNGIRNNWFNHPFNFDPVWLISCTGFSPIDSNIGVNDDTEQKPCT